MNDELFECTKMAAYFLWEHTGCDNALSLWYCAEDIACYLEQNSIFSYENVNDIIELGYENAAYIYFVRHIAFRIYIYTNCDDALTNWFAAERLLDIDEWIKSITTMAVIYRKEQANHTVMDEVRSENVRTFYNI